jgi:8-oxo-dGTP pyrophosphatase MutT (NUDIX family)
VAGSIQLPHMLQAYMASQPELVFKDRFIELLKHPQAYHRDHLPGHITGSAWVLNQDRSKVLLVHHAKLNRWLQPGGHADGDEDVVAVALRELEEETGVKGVTHLGSGIFDIDIHPIPTRKDFPQHDHYDVRFAFIANENEPLLVSEESHDVKWVLLAELDRFTDSESVHRMARKSSFTQRTLS